MGGHGHDSHGPPYRIPDHTQFSSIKGIKELEQLEEALARRGLRDPWIRNEIWRYHPGFGSHWWRIRMTFFRGIEVGLGLTLLTLAYNKFLGGGSSHHHEGDTHH